MCAADGAAITTAAVLGVLGTGGVLYAVAVRRRTLPHPSGLLSPDTAGEPSWVRSTELPSAKV